MMSSALLGRWVPDGRVAMLAPYVNAPSNSRVTRATGTDSVCRGTPRALGPPLGGALDTRGVSDRDTTGPNGGQPASGAPTLDGRS